MTPRERAERFVAESVISEPNGHVEDLTGLIEEAIEDALDTSRAAGKEAEELRDGLAEILKDWGGADLEARIRAVLDDVDIESRINDLLDEVDACDANQWLLYKSRIDKLEEIVGALAHYGGTVVMDNGTPIVRAARNIMGIK